MLTLSTAFEMHITGSVRPLAMAFLTSERATTTAKNHHISINLNGFLKPETVPYSYVF